jgi:ribosomal protein S18 acetylase RimI-like enzyme
MQIRKLEPNDAMVWKKLRLESLVKHPENYLSAIEEESLLTDEDWQQRIAQNDVYGLFEDKQLVSIASMKTMSRLKCSHVGEIWGVYTIPDARGKGYSSQLLKHLLTDAKHKVDHCILTCTTTNQGAFHIYQKLGFRVYGIDNKAIKVGENYYDEYMMTLEWSPVPKKTLEDKEKYFQYIQSKPRLSNHELHSTLNRFSLLKTNLSSNGRDIPRLFKDCIVHDVSGGRIWQTMVYYIRLLGYYLFNMGRYHEMSNLLSTLNPEQNQQLKMGLQTDDIHSYMIKCR